MHTRADQLKPLAKRILFERGGGIPRNSRRDLEIQVGG